ncbi:MAG: long-chain fatty acid--CoA ligase [Myxococcales bacterium]|nr:long-chain fatty acid--CoA ligase [Myxococcales bacterium]MCB9734799.1 long-chain fatty acid--CoA ligase [Deltaproteobacteria bacterium]
MEVAEKSPFLTELAPAPRVLFDLLDERGDLPRFHVRDEAGAWQPILWRDFTAEVRRVAVALQALDLASEARAAIFAPNRITWLSAAYGIQAAGGAMVPVYPASTAEQAGYVIGHSEAQIVFVDTPALIARLVAALPHLSRVRRFVLLDPATPASAAAALGEDRVIAWADLMALGEAHDRDGAFERRLDGIDLDDVGLMLYTSGTSGPPKGVPLTHRNVASNGRDWLENNDNLLPGPAGPEDVDLLWLPFSHIYGFGEASLGNTLGFQSYLCEPAEVLGLMPVVRPTIFMSVPAYWEKLSGLAAGDADKLRELTGGRIRFCLSGGAGLKREVKEAFLAAGMLIIEGYGLTEASPTLTMNKRDHFRFDTVGLPFPSVELRLAEDGEIQARGPNVFGGYHNDAEATKSAFTEDGWLKTGDLGRFTDDGFLQIIGRKKEILVTAGGKNVPPANIEQRFADDPLIAHVVVYGDGQKYLVAGVWPEEHAAVALLAARGVAPEGPEADAVLRDELAARVAAVNAELASYETIKKFAVFRGRPLTVDGGHLTTTLKLRRHKIAEAFGAELDALYAV